MQGLVFIELFRIFKMFKNLLVNKLVFKLNYMVNVYS